MMEKHYDPKGIEEKWYKTWCDRGYFHGDSSRGGEPYVVVIPPPNVTGILHMGHALNNTIQDILVRWKRMEGKNVVWLPGTDHAGIATQNVVERALKKEGKTREDLGREAFIERVWEWREEYGSTIINQLKRLGSSCDWERERFTMDEGLSNAVSEVFVRLYDKGLIHKGNYIINWCPRCHTALSDEESEHADTDGNLYYIKYPVLKPSAKPMDSATQLADDAEEGKDYIVVATTRPETLLGDVAVAVNPKDKRYDSLVNKKVILPVLNRELTVIRDDFVDLEFGTGIVKVTPAHDPNDFEMGQRHNLEQINVLNGNATMNAEAGPYEGMDRFECRKKILEDLKKAGLIDKIKKHNHAVGHCYRCDTVVEPRLSPQWFVKMKPLAEPALKAVNEGKVNFVPGRWTKVYQEWMENIRDWCISRQIWWGHRIPIFYCDNCNHEWAAKGQPDNCPECSSSNIRQDEDVLDTWFSSWLWPFSTFGWPESNADLKLFYPTHDLVTASEIIFFWVARMIMAGIEFMGDVPFETVYIHGTVRDDDGRKMSKSLGNALDPLTIIDEFSADALRFSLTMLTATGQDVYVSTDKFEIGRNFGTKLWNAGRFLQMKTGDDFSPNDALTPDFDPALMSSDDKHIIAQLDKAIVECTSGLEKRRFNDAAHALYEFVWHQYCDWYVEYAKNPLASEDEAQVKHALSIMHYLFSTSLRLLHPMIPFVTEELWHAMGYGTEDETIMLAPWPTGISDENMTHWGIDDEALKYVEDKHEMIRVGRVLRADYGIPTAKKITYLIKPKTNDVVDRLQSDKTAIASSLRAEKLSIDADLDVDEKMPSAVSKLGTVFMPLDGIIDVDAEKNRLTAQLDKTMSKLAVVERKLGNENYVSRAPEEVVNKTRENKKTLLEESEKIKTLIQALC